MEISWCNLKLRTSSSSVSGSGGCGEESSASTESTSNSQEYSSSPELSSSRSKKNKVNNNNNGSGESVKLAEWEEFERRTLKSTRFYDEAKYEECSRELQSLTCSTSNDKNQQSVGENLAIVRLELDGDYQKFLKDIKLPQRCLALIRTSETNYQRCAGVELAEWLNTDALDDSDDCDDYDHWALRVYNRCIALAKYSKQSSCWSAAVFLLESFLFARALHTSNHLRPNNSVFNSVQPLLLAKLLFLLIVIYVEKEYRYHFALKLILIYCDFCKKNKLPQNVRIANLQARCELLYTRTLPNTVSDECENVFDSSLRNHCYFLQKQFTSMTSASSSPIESGVQALKQFFLATDVYDIRDHAYRFAQAAGDGHNFELSFNHALISLGAQRFADLESIYDTVVSESKNPLVWSRFGDLRLAACIEQENSKRTDSDALLLNSSIVRIHDKSGLTVMRLLDCGSVKIGRFKLPSKCYETSLKWWNDYEKFVDKNHREEEQLNGALESVDFLPHSLKHHLLGEPTFLSSSLFHMKLSLGYCYLSANKYTWAYQILRPFREFEKSDLNDARLILFGHLYSAEACVALNQIKQAYELLNFTAIVHRLNKCAIAIGRNSVLRSVFAYNLLSLHASLGLCDNLTRRIAKHLHCSSTLSKGRILNLALFEHLRAGDTVMESALSGQLLHTTYPGIKPKTNSVAAITDSEAMRLFNIGWSEQQIRVLLSDSSHMQVFVFDSKSAEQNCTNVQSHNRRWRRTSAKGQLPMDSGQS